MIALAQEVADALRDGRAVVALETTLVAHGFPPGEGVEVGLESERRVRAGGAVPATVGVLDGAVRIGLSEEELHRFGADARKVGPRDLAAAAVRASSARRRSAGRSRSAAPPASRSWRPAGSAASIAAGPSIPTSRPTSASSRARVLVVSAGIKSLLDVPATSEVLETLGVPVLGYRTDELPLFYAARGGPPTSGRVESAAEAAQVAREHWSLGGGGILLARPPDESLDDVEPLIEEALREAREQGVSGQAVTPFVLSFLHERSGGRTLAANRALIAQNAQLAAEVAVAFAGQEA